MICYYYFICCLLNKWGFTIFRYYLNLWKFRISGSISYSLGGTQTESNSFYCFLRISRVYVSKHDKLYEDNHRKHNYSATSSPRNCYSGELPETFLLVGSVFGDVSSRNEIGPWKFHII